MKFIILGFITASLLLNVSCSKKDEGNGGGQQAAPAAQPPPPKPPAPPPPPPSHDNACPPTIMDASRHGIIQDVTMTIHNSDGMSIRAKDPRMGDRKLEEFTFAVPLMEYTQCLQGLNRGRWGGGYAVDFGGFDYRRACYEERQYINHRRGGRSRPNSCMSYVYNSISNKAMIETRFMFDVNGYLHFHARIDGFDYKGTNIGYKYNKIKKQMAIRPFLARGSNPVMPLLAVSSVSSVRGAERGSGFMVLREMDAPVDAIQGQLHLLSFAEPVLLRLSGLEMLPPFNQRCGDKAPTSLQPQPYNPQHFPTINYAATRFLVAGGNAHLVDLNYAASLTPGQAFAPESYEYPID